MQDSEKIEKKDFEQLYEENIRLRQLLQKNNIDFESKVSEYNFIENDLFLKARSISKLAYWHYSLIEKKLEISIEAYKILEIKPLEPLNTQLLLNLLHPESKLNFTTEIKNRVEKEDFFSIDSRLLVPDGSTKYISVKFIVERDGSNNINSISGTLTDITENHFMIDRLIGNEKLFRSLFNSLTDIFIIFEIIKDSDGKIIDYIYKDVNPTFEMKFSTSKAEVIDKKLSLRPGHFQQLNPLFQLSVIAGQPQQDRIYFQSLDSFFDILIYSPSEDTLATIWRDVTLMVDAESSLRESEEKYRQIFSIGSDALFMFDHSSGRILDVNPTACNLFGYPKESLLKMAFKQLSTTPDDLDEQIQNQKSLLHDFISVKSNNTEFPVEISLSYFYWSGRKVSVASIRDISERILAQERLIKSEQKFKQLFDYSNDAILILKNYRIVDFNQKSLELFRISSEGLLNKTIWNLSPSKQISGEESRNRAVELIQNSLLGNQHQFEWNFLRQNRDSFIADIKLSPIMVGNEKLVQAILRDISPLKETQNALKMREELWKSALKTSNIGVWELNILTHEVFFSSSWKNIIGFQKEELPNKIEEFYNRVHNDDIIPLKKALDEYFSSVAELVTFDFRLRCKNGTYKWIRLQGKIYKYNDDGKPERFVATHTDITKIKLHEEKLNLQIHDFTFSNNISLLGYWALDLKTMIISGHRDTFLLLGFADTEQLTLRQVEKIIHPEDQKFFISQFVSHSNNISFENIFRIITNNTTRYILAKSRPIKNSKNILTGFRGTFQDISNLKSDSTKLTDERNFFKSIAEGSQNSMIIIREKNVIYANTKISELTGYSTKEITSKNITPFDFIITEDQYLFKKTIEKILTQNSQPEKIEIRIQTKTNRIKWVELTPSIIDLKEGVAIQYSFTDISSRKYLEFELLQNDNNYKSILSNSPSAIFQIDYSGKICFYNEQFLSISGLTQNELKNTNYQSLFNDKDFAIISKGIESLSLSISKQFSFDLLHLGKNKQWMRLNVISIFSESNEIGSFIFYCENIDYEKRKLLNLEEENDAIHVITQNATFGYALINSQQEILKFNPEFVKDLDIITKSKLFSHISDIDKFSQYFIQIIRGVLSDNNPRTVEINTKPNKFIQIEFIPVSFNNENCIISFTHDISKLKITLNSLSNELERFKKLFENAPLAITLLDKNRNSVVSNSRFELYFVENQFIEEPTKLDNLIDSQYLGEAISNFSQLFAGITNTFQLSMKMNPKGKESFWVNANVSSIIDSYGDPTYAILIIEDISHLKKEEDSLLINERHNTLHYIADSFAHQFNNLLMGIYGNSYLLKSYLSNNTLEKYAAQILSSTSKASELTHRLLSFSERKTNISINLNGNSFLSETIDSLECPASISISKVLNTKDEIIAGDPLQLKKAVQHIACNAIESMGSEGILTFESNIVFFEPEKGDEFENLEKGKYFKIAITDTGTGIPPSDISKIFDPFYSTKPSGLNTGLGLSIAKEIITSHKGIIKVFSSLGKGTNFSIYLPVKESSKNTVSFQPDERLIDKGSAKILLVDDEEVVRLITSELLNELGYDVYSFANGKKAIKFYKDNYQNIDLVLLDKFMPEMDGIEVFYQLKNINPALKAILLTGFNIDSALENRLTDNLCGYIQKPVSIEKLSQAIAEILFH